MNQDRSVDVALPLHDLTPSSSEQRPATSARSFDIEHRLRLMRDGMVNYSGFVTSGLAGIILVPVMLRCLGTESYGLWLVALAGC